MKAGMQLVAEQSSAILQVHYEQLVENPVENLRQILSFCELSDDAELLGYAATVMKRGAARERPEIAPAIAEPFGNTMKALGY